MGEMSKWSTVHFEPEVHQALRLNAASTGRSLSEIVNEAIRVALREDLDDLRAFEDRAGEAIASYGDLLNDLKRYHKT